MKSPSPKTPLGFVEPESATHPPPTDYGTINSIETPPTDEWFYETAGPQRQSLVYLRFQATGLLSRMIGPFASREVALWTLDNVLDHVLEGLEEAYNRPEHTVRIPFHRRRDLVTIENPYRFSHTPSA